MVNPNQKNNKNGPQQHKKKKQSALGPFFLVMVLFQCFTVWGVYHLNTSQQLSFNERGTTQLHNNYRKIKEPDNRNMTALLEWSSHSRGYEHATIIPFEPLQKHKPKKHHEHHHGTGIEETIRRLNVMGMNASNPKFRSYLPPWEDIVDNYGSDPIVLGMERCAAFRQAVPREQRRLGPAGLFSTGTNVLNQYLLHNCRPPSGKHIAKNQLKKYMRTRFSDFQVPWGKHNPASGRMTHVAMHMEHINQTAVLPIVMVRHPLTWMEALCQHPYVLEWRHSVDHCSQTLKLQNKVEGRFGMGNVTYPSLMHVWYQWNQEYFQTNEYPLLMVRMEDLVYRPKEVVTEICHCVGGHVEESKPFWYSMESTANQGVGHGDHRSNLAMAFLKYGRRLTTLYDKEKVFSAIDWRMIRQVRSYDKTNATRSLLKTLHYRI